MANEVQLKKEPKRGGSFISGFIFGIVFMLIGLVISGASSYFLAQYKVSETWPSTGGIVVESFIEIDDDGENGNSYYPRVIYEYSVNGARYASQQVKIGFVQSFGTENGANKVLTSYPVGKNVTVYYDPAEPVIAVLERSTSQITPYLYVGGGLFLIGFFSFSITLFNYNTF